jgi:signal transduction histidine kinase
MRASILLNSDSSGMQIEHSDFNDQLVRGLAHKMNNILSLFHGYISLLLANETLDPAIGAGLARIKEGACAASELMDRTKALARPTSVVWRQIGLEEFLLTLRPTFETFCERGITVETFCDPTLEPLWIDTARLRTALLEIVRNACEASSRGGKVRVRVEPENRSIALPEEGIPPVEWIAIAVTNQGEPILPELEAKIFQPFFSTKYKTHSTGLGLTVALGSVQQMGGVIRFTSDDEYTTFRLVLPARVEGF